jgi:ribosomal protein L11 methyltransferase
MDHARFTLTFGNFSHDEAFALLERLEAELRIDAMAISINETDEAKAIWETVAWFGARSEAEAAREVIGIVTAAITEVENRDWVRESLAGLAPVSAGRFFLHGSHDRSLRSPGGIAMEIDAGTAFGTGHHGTTKGCLLAFDTLLKRARPARVFDLGTGTGVLALAAAKVLRRKVLASDIDAEAVRVTALNARHNGLGPLITAVTAAGLHAPAIHAHAPFDLIFANILAKPLERLATGIATLLAPAGHVILSGLTRDQERWILACYRARGLVLVQALRLDNWVVLVMQRKSAQRKTRKKYSSRVKSAVRGSGYAENV